MIPTQPYIPVASLRGDDLLDALHRCAEDSWGVSGDRSLIEAIGHGASEALADLERKLKVAQDDNAARHAILDAKQQVIDLLIRDLEIERSARLAAERLLADREDEDATAINLTPAACCAP